MMRVNNHGGACCGIKTIFGFPYTPSTPCAAMPKRVVFQGAGNEQLHPGKDFYPGPAPMETGLKRLTRLLDYIDLGKESHLIEVTLTGYYASNWEEVLKSKGFYKKSEFENSNTDTVIVVYHRITHNRKVVKQED